MALSPKTLRVALGVLALVAVGVLAVYLREREAQRQQIRAREQLEDEVKKLANEYKEGSARAADISTRLEEIGPEPLVAILTDKTGTGSHAGPFRDSYRVAAVKALGILGPKAEAAVPALASAIGETDTRVALSSVGQEAIKALGRIGPGAKPAVPALVAALDAPNAEKLFFRRDVLEALGRIGPAAQEAVPALVNRLATEPPRLTESPAAALDRIDPNWRTSEAAKSAVAVLAKELADPDKQKRAHAAEKLRPFCAAAAPALPGLIAALEGQDRNLRNQAIWTIGNIGLSALPAVPAMIKVLSDPDADNRASVALFLGEFGPPAAEAIPALIRTLGDQDPRVRERAAGALGKIGPATGAVVSALTRVVADESEEPDVRQAAAVALGNIGPSARDAIPTLERLAAHPKLGDLSRAFVNEAIDRIRKK